MNNGAFGENFPYTNFHDLNLDWIIKIAKDFLDQYTHIQETIDTGLTDLDNKATELENLLQEWYDTHSENIAQQLAQAISDFTEEAERVGANVIASIPPDYTELSESVNAFYLLNNQQFVIYDNNTKVLTIPGTAFCIYKGTPHTVSNQQVLNLSTILQSGACNLWMKSDYSIIAVKFTERPEDTDALYLGSVYYGYVHINGVSNDQIRIVTTDNLRHLMFLNNMGSFIGLSSDWQHITVNNSAKTITFPGGFKVYRGTTFPYSQESISFSSSSASKIWMKNDGSLYTTQWDNNNPANTDDDCIGYIYGPSGKIAGVPDSAIFFTENTNNVETIAQGSGLSFGDAYIGIADWQEVVYDSTTHIIKFPAGGFYVYRGVGRARGEIQINLTDNLVNDAGILYMTYTGTIYCKKWSSKELVNPNDQIVGYVFYETVYINGVPQSHISVTHNRRTVYCFGDSIMAGTNTDKNFMQFMHDRDRNIIFKNYAVGSTGYSTEATGTVIAGNGSTENGTSTTVSGNNTIRDIINSVASQTINNIMIFAGTNDWSANTPIADFRTAVRNTFSRAKDFTQNIFVVLPIKRQNWNTATNSLGLKLEDYATVIREECINEAIAYFDGYNVFINPNLGTQRTAFIPDGLHPNRVGHARIARAIYATAMEGLSQY